MAFSLSTSPRIGVSSARFDGYVPAIFLGKSLLNRFTVLFVKARADDIVGISLLTKTGVRA
jgi:hypothetical protein